MEKQRKDYYIYPSLLQAYQNLLDYQLVAEEDWNKVSEAAQSRGEYLDREIGDYKLTPEEMYLKLEADLIDSINRIDGTYGESADKGTAFNEIVDCIIENRKSNREDCEISTVYPDNGHYVKRWLDSHKNLLNEATYRDILRLLNSESVIRAKIHDYTFDFDPKLCKEVASCFPGSLTQYYANAEMETRYGIVHLYGFIDEWVGNEITDIKTTSRYEFGKFSKGWQRHIYPWCVIEKGDATEIESFTYYVVEWAYQRNGEPIKAKNIHKETYTYSHEDSGKKIKEMCESFIEWLENRKDFIQDKKIFGGENPQNWHGTPVDTNELERVIFKETA